MVLKVLGVSNNLLNGWLSLHLASLAFLIILAVSLLLLLPY